jgi:hypothetical protein
MPGRVSDAVLEQFAVMCRPADLPAALRRRYAGLLGRVSLYFPISLEDPESRWQAFIRDFRRAS